MADTITFEEFKKIEVRIGKVTLCEKVEGADKLLRLEVDFGEFGKRQIASAIAEYYKPEELVGKLLPFIVNLEPRTFRGVESQGMLMATGDENGVVLLLPSKDIAPGAEVV